MNMYTIEKQDCKQFEAPFRLESGSKAYIGALITYFDIVFTEGVQPITFTIQPGWHPTTDSPMIFFLSHSGFQIDDEESLYGVFRMKSLSDDCRKIDWNIEIMFEGEHSQFREGWHFESR